MVVVYDNYSWADVSFSSKYSSSNQTVAGATDYWPYIDLVSAGTATITATYSECKQVPPFPGEGSGCECSFISIRTVTRQDTSTVVVKAPPDHVVVIVDHLRFPTQSFTTGVIVRQMLMQVVDVNGNPVTSGFSIDESQSEMSVR